MVNEITLALALAANYVDYRQTDWVANHQVISSTKFYHEEDPLIGNPVTHRNVNRFFVAKAAVLIGKQLVFAPGWSIAVNVADGANEIHAVRGNTQVGIKFHF